MYGDQMLKVLTYKPLKYLHCQFPLDVHQQHDFHQHDDHHQHDHHENKGRLKDEHSCNQHHYQHDQHKHH